jgi:hypothetical protein
MQLMELIACENPVLQPPHKGYWAILSPWHDASESQLQLRLPQQYPSGHIATTSTFVPLTELRIVPQNPFFTLILAPPLQVAE